MSATILDALPGEQVLYSNALAAVTSHCIVLTGIGGQTQTILALSRLSRIKRITVSYPILLVIAAGSLILGLAAFSSKEGAGAGAPFAIFGLLLLAGYFLSRRGAVCFTVDSEVFETVFGSPGEAAELIAAIESAQRLYNREASTG
jgi:MYXO-CTERM domain-containing protein